MPLGGDTQNDPDPDFNLDFDLDSVWESRSRARVDPPRNLWIYFPVTAPGRHPG